MLGNYGMLGQTEYMYIENSDGRKMELNALKRMKAKNL